MNVTIIGGGSWGTTLAQVLSDNNNDVLIYDINIEHVNKINKHRHPFYEITLPYNIKATTSLEESLNFSDMIVLAVPSKASRVVLKNINKLLKEPISIISVSKGIEPITFNRISEICYQEIDNKFIKDFCVLTGPSHAEEVILRRLTLLTAASKSLSFAKVVQQLFTNDEYMRVYISDDIIGAEVCGAAKNAISLINGAGVALNMGENATAALMTRGSYEIVKLVVHMGGQIDTVYGLSGIGDLIVTANSTNSRNYNAGKKIGEGVSITKVLDESLQTVEGIRSIEACYQYGKKHNLDLPIINMAYSVLFENVSFDDAIRKLLKRKLGKEIK